MTPAMRIIELPAGAATWDQALPVLQELRPHLTAEGLHTALRDGGAQGLVFIGIFDDDQCVAVAGYRLINNTSAGRKLYVDDLVVTETRRSLGAGRRIFAELVRRAEQLHCTALDLDSGVQRFDAHKFYFQNGMHIRSHHFALSL